MQIPTITLSNFTIRVGFSDVRTIFQRQWTKSPRGFLCRRALEWSDRESFQVETVENFLDDHISFDFFVKSTECDDLTVLYLYGCIANNMPIAVLIIIYEGNLSRLITFANLDHDHLLFAEIPAGENEGAESRHLGRLSYAQRERSPSQI
jgi:hypothetical protein